MSEKVVTALVVAADCTSRVNGHLHAAHYLSSEIGKKRQLAELQSAREEAEKMLVAILAAEQSLAPAVKSDNVIAIGDHDCDYQRKVDAVAAEIGASA